MIFINSNNKGKIDSVASSLKTIYNRLANNTLTENNINKTQKKVLYIDFDNTIVNTDKAMIGCLNSLIREPELVIRKEYSTEWNFVDVCPEHYRRFVPVFFNTKALFSRFEFFDGCYDILEKLSKKTKIVVVTIGEPENIVRKIRWLRENLPFVHVLPIVYIDGENVKMDKSCIQMQDGIMIDDNQECLYSCNAIEKILFSHNKVVKYCNNRWNVHQKDGEVFVEWNDEFYKYILKSLHIEED